MNSDIENMLEALSKGSKSLLGLKNYLEQLIKLYTHNKIFYTGSSSDKILLNNYLTTVENMLNTINTKRKNLKNFNDNWVPKISGLLSKNLSKDFTYSSFVSSTGYTKIEYRKILSVKLSSVSFDGQNLKVNFEINEKKNKVTTTTINFSTNVKTSNINTSNRSMSITFSNDTAGFTSFVSCCNNDLKTSNYSIIWNSKLIATFILR